jgi:hypothetical protein
MLCYVGDNMIHGWYGPFEAQRTKVTYIMICHQVPHLAKDLYIA